MRYLKCNLPPERHEEILGKFWHYPTQEEEDAVHAARVFRDLWQRARGVGDVLPAAWDHR